MIINNEFNLIMLMIPWLSYEKKNRENKLFVGEKNLADSDQVCDIGAK